MLRRRGRRPSLQRRLLALVLGVVAVVWSLAALLTWRDARHELDELLDGHLAQAAALLVAQQVRELGEDPHADDDGGDHGVDAPALHRYAPQAVFQVFHEGRLVLRSANAPAAPMAAARSGFSTVALAGERWRVFAARGAEHDVQVYVGERARSRESILWAVLRSTLWPMALALPLLAAAAGWAVHRGLAPLRELGRVLAARGPGTPHPLALADTPAEMAPLVDALNGLFRRVHELLESERRFTADAAHELRTPIAAIRAQAQVAWAASEEPGRRQALQNTLAGCDRATRLVEQLLTLARLEAAEAPSLGPVDLGMVVRAVLADAAPAALARGQDVALEAQPGCVVAGEPTLLAVLVRNLVDNAVRYSPAGARITVAVAREAGDGVTLAVEDGGPGLADPERARLGERFFRVAGTGEVGSGLGWSIVRRIAAVHAAAVETTRSARLGGLAVRVAFQAASAAAPQVAEADTRAA